MWFLLILYSYVTWSTRQSWRVALISKESFYSGSFYWSLAYSVGYSSIHNIVPCPQGDYILRWTAIYQEPTIWLVLMFLDSACENDHHLSTHRRKLHHPDVSVKAGVTQQKFYRGSRTLWTCSCTWIPVLPTYWGPVTRASQQLFLPFIKERYDSLSKPGNVERKRRHW